MTVISGEPGLAISPALSGRSATMPDDRADDAGIGDLRLLGLVVRLGRSDLRGGALDLFFFGHRLQRLSDAPRRLDTGPRPET